MEKRYKGDVGQILFEEEKMQVNKKRITALGIFIVTLGFLAKKDRRDEFRFWLEYQANRLGMIKKHTKGV